MINIYTDRSMQRESAVKVLMLVLYIMMKRRKLNELKLEQIKIKIKLLQKVDSEMSDILLV